MRKLVLTLVVVTISSLAGCSPDNDSDSDGENGTPIAGTLDDLFSRSADSLPVDDGLDQVNADLLNIFGEADADPVTLDDNQTVASLIARQGTSR